MSGLTDSDLLADTIHRLEEANQHAEITASNREAHYDELVYLRSSLLKLRDLTDDIDQRIAATFEDGEKVPLGTKVFEAKRTARRTRWDKDLYRAVLDSRRLLPNGLPDPEWDGESPTEKLAHVWPHTGPNARLTALRERGIDPDEWCETEWRPAKLTEVRK